MSLSPWHQAWRHKQHVLGTCICPLYQSPWSCCRDKPIPVPKAYWGPKWEEKDEHRSMAMALSDAPEDAPSLHPSAPNNPSL